MFRNPAIVVSIIGVVAAVIFGLLQLRQDPPAPSVVSINPSTVVVGGRFDVLGRKLNLVSELLLVKRGLQIRLETIRKGETHWIVGVEGEVSPSEYSLMIKTTDGKEVPTQHMVNVVAKVETPDPDATLAPPTAEPSATLTPTPLPTATPTFIPEPTATIPPPADTPKWTCETLVSEESDKFFPLAITSDTGGNVYVLDGKVSIKQYRVRKFSVNESQPIIWDINLEDIDSPLNAPKGIAVELRNGRTWIYVADTGSNVVRLLIVEVDGNQEKIHQRGSWGSVEGIQSPYRPYGIALDRSSNVYVADEANARVEIFSSKYLFAYDRDLEGLFISDPIVNWMGKNGIQLENPAGLARDNKGRVYVVDAGHHRLLRFDENGVPEVIPEEAVSSFRNPSGIAIDFNDKIYVADTGNNRVQILRSDTDEISDSFSNVTLPEGIATDSKKNVYVIPLAGRLERCSPVQTP